MHALLKVVVVLVLAVQWGGAGAAETDPPTVQLVDATRHFTLEDTLRLHVPGPHQIPVMNAKATGVWLVIDDVVMQSLGAPTAELDAAGTGLVLSYRLSMDPNSDDSRNQWEQLLEKQHGGYQMTLPLALAIGTAAALPVAGNGMLFHVTSQHKALITLGLCLALFLLLFWRLAHSGSALRDFPDGPYSLGKSQMAFWGLLVALTFIGVWFNTRLIEYIPQQVLILLGISGGTGLGALVIGNGTKAAEITALEQKLTTLRADDVAGRTAAKARLQVLRAPPTDVSKGFFHDICDDGNGIGFHRLQTVMWTLILGFIFIAHVTKVISMPEFPETLLTLMGISNSVYLGFKFPEKA